MQRRRKQNGVILQIGHKWYVRYWERRNVGGVIERRRVTHCLGEITTRGKTPPAEIVKEAERHMATVNDCSIPVGQIVTLSDFVENTFLPNVARTLRKSSSDGYQRSWDLHLKPLVNRERTNMKDLQTFHVQSWLDQIAKDGQLSRASLKGIKSMISGAFKEARRLGYYTGSNPVRDTRVDPHAAPPAPTHAYSLEEIATILSLLPEPAATIFAVAAYTGLRRGEIEGLRWEDYRDGELNVSRSLWNGEIVEPKTAKSRAAVPVIRLLAERLEIHRLRSGNPEDGTVPQSGPIFRTSVGTPFSLQNVVNQQILPALRRCVHCGVSEGLPHLKSKTCSNYERDSSIPEWQGFHAARRGLGSNLYRMGVHELVIQKILRHSNVATTTSYYVKTTASDVKEAMEQFEQKLEGQTLRDTDGTLNSALGATSRTVN
ncbi:putative Phage integrase [Candidatus Sulfotelmatobacter kueseliae]|uniref:Putative Phage integrase n=1 Tax=Candidatus Sulfotelmatobacter kueseliae TaxID=2042962 RepID=A0A2U3JXE1_9BACT|nr:putative Phage integrase [Candidatus Sulfotelmatobacter kueseliae]